MSTTNTDFTQVVGVRVLLCNSNASFDVCYTFLLNIFVIMSLQRTLHAALVSVAFCAASTAPYAQCVKPLFLVQVELTLGNRIGCRSH